MQERGIRGLPLRGRKHRDADLGAPAQAHDCGDKERDAGCPQQANFGEEVHEKNSKYGAWLSA